jgi:hypothetical protein
MALSINEHGAVPVFLMLDTVSDPPAGEVRLLKDAHSSGFLVFNLLDLWMNRDQSALVITPWDNHPNAAGNRLIAERLVELVRQHQAKLHLQLVERQRGSH